MQSVGSTSVGLLERVKAREKDAWDRLVQLYGPLVDAWIRRSGLQSADCDDVFQEVFKAISQGIGNFRKAGPRDTFRGWLRTVVTSKVQDHFRRTVGHLKPIGGSENHRQLHELAAAQPSDDLSSDRSESRRLHLGILNVVQAEFEHKTWEMFWRLAAEGHAAREVADEFGVSPSAVRLAKSRILARIREELSGLEDYS